MAMLLRTNKVLRMEIVCEDSCGPSGENTTCPILSTTVVHILIVYLHSNSVAQVGWEPGANHQ